MHEGKEAWATQQSAQVLSCHAGRLHRDELPGTCTIPGGIHKVTVFGNRVFADIKEEVLLERADPGSRDCRLYQRKDRRIQTHRGRAGREAVARQARPRPEGPGRCPPEPREGRPCSQLRARPQSSGRPPPCSCRPPSLWSLAAGPRGTGNAPRTASTHLCPPYRVPASLLAGNRPHATHPPTPLAEPPPLPPPPRASRRLDRRQHGRKK